MRPLRFRARPTVRLRLTLLYGGLFLAFGLALLIVNYFLVRRSIAVRPAVLRQRIQLQLGDSLFSFPAPPLSEYRRVDRLLKTAASDLRAEALHALIVQNAIAFGAMVVVCLGLGWLVAARVLRPLTKITGAARRLSGETLHERIGLQGPKDELKELADTFDEMLERLDAAFESQRRFVANASHELRTPLSIIRTELDVTLADPSPTPEEYAAMAETVRLATERSERIIDSLLVLARSEGAAPGSSEVDLRGVVADVLSGLEDEAVGAGVEVRTDLRPAAVAGDATLLERLVENLVRNAVAYNRAGGWVEVATRLRGGRAHLRVRNSGPDMEALDMDALFEPFRRHGPDRVGSARGVGLGLAIVRAVAKAHGGQVSAAPLPGGGLDVTVELEAATEPEAALASASR